MPRGRRAQNASSPTLTADRFHGFVRGIAPLKQKVSDANMAHAAAWQRAEPMGIHPQAAKLYCRLDDMEAAKRTAFLRAFDQYREWSEWEAQLDMFEGPAPAEAELVEQPPIGDHERAGGEDAEEQFGDDHDGVPADDRAPPPGEVEADHGEDSLAEATEELAATGEVFAAGREAAEQGVSAEDNPHRAGSHSHNAWARGHEQGLRDREIEPAAAEGAPERPAGRRGRRAAIDAPVLVH